MIIREDNIRDLQRLKAILKRGGVAILPAYTLYGLSASVFDVFANRRIFEIKKRFTDSPFIVIAKKEFILDVADDVDKNKMEFLIDNNITVVVKTSVKMPFYASKNSKTAFRLANTKLLKKVTSQFPITSTSINISGKNSINDIKTIAGRYRFFVDIVVSGKVKNEASTVVELDKDSVKILREGCCFNTLKEIGL